MGESAKEKARKMEHILSTHNMLFSREVVVSEFACFSDTANLVSSPCLANILQKSFLETLLKVFSKVGKKLRETVKCEYFL